MISFLDLVDGLSCGQRRTAGDHDPIISLPVCRPFGGEPGGKVFPQKYGSGKRIPGKLPRKPIGDAVAGGSVPAPELYLVTFRHTGDLLGREIALVAALDPIAVLLQKESMFALAREKVHFDVPTAAYISLGRVHFIGAGTALLRKDAEKPVRYDLCVPGTHLAGRYVDRCPVFCRPRPYGNPGGIAVSY